MLAIVVKQIEISNLSTQYFSFPYPLRPPWCLCGESSYSRYIQPLRYHLFVRGLPWSFVAGRTPGSDLCKHLCQGPWCVHCPRLPCISM